MRAVRRKRTTLVLGFTTGLLLGLLLFGRRGCFESAREALRDLPPREDPLRLVSLPPGPPPRRLLLFAGVMTAAKYLPTRAAAVHGTWGKKVPGRMAFFSGRDSRRPENSPDLPLVALPSVDDSYPPQKKSFQMLDYMYTNYIDHFEWFLRADDDVYIRMDKLETFLRSVDSRKPFFIGQAGRGNQEEFGRLSLEYDENFCMGGPGVILSRETLSRVAPHVRACLSNLYTTHEDVELGRCVQKFAGVSCTWSYEMQTIFYHNSSGKDAFTGNLKQKEVHRAITLHPVKDHSNLYRIHNYMQMLRIQELQEESVNLHRDMLSMSHQLNMTSLEAFPQISPYSRDYLGDTTLLGQKPGLNKYKGKSRNDLIPWDFIQRAVYSDTNSNPRRKIESALKEGLDDVVREAMEKINMYSKQRGRIIDFKDILYGYHRYNPLYGADYILDMLLIYRKYRGKKMTVPVRRHTYFQQQFTGMEIREVFEGEEVGGGREEIEEEEDTNDNGSFKEAFETGLMKISGNLPSILLPSAEQHNNPDTIIKDKVVNFIVPLSGRFETFQRFVKIFEEVCLSNYEKVTLRVVLFPHDESNIKSSLDVVRRLQEKYQYTSITVVPVFEEFSRAKALDIGATHVKEPNDLLFFIDVDMVFDRGILHRIRTNTIRGKQVYFPIVYSEYDPKVIFNLTVSPNHFLINQETGFWRQFGFGIASVYKTDLIKVGGYNTTIKGWGKEDVDLFDRFVKSGDKINIFRSADPELVHVFHPVECDPKLNELQRKMCLGTRADTYAGIKTLSDILHRNEKAFNFAQNIR